MGRRLALALAALIAVAALRGVAAYEVDMVFQTKCIFEDVAEGHTEVTAAYSAYAKGAPDSPVPVTLKVEDPDGRVVFERLDAAAGDIRLPKVPAGEYKLCFTCKDYATAQATSLSVEWRTGAEAHDWGAVAKHDKLSAIQTEVLKLESVAQGIHAELQQIRRTEEEMRDVNELVNARVAWFSIGAVVTCVGLAASQLWYLRKFFIRKKVL